MFIGGSITWFGVVVVFLISAGMGYGIRFLLDKKGSTNIQDIIISILVVEIFLSLLITIVSVRLSML